MDNDVRVWVACGSRAIAGTFDETAIFSLPGSPHAVKLGLDLIVLDVAPILAQTIDFFRNRNPVPLPVRSRLNFKRN